MRTPSHGACFLTDDNPERVPLAGGGGGWQAPQVTKRGAGLASREAEEGLRPGCWAGLGGGGGGLDLVSYGSTY